MGILGISDWKETWQLLYMWIPWGQLSFYALMTNWYYECKLEVIDIYIG